MLLFVNGVFELESCFVNTSLRLVAFPFYNVFFVFWYTALAAKFLGEVVKSAAVFHVGEFFTADAIPSKDDQ